MTCFEARKQMLNLIGADWQPIFVDFVVKGVPRTAEYRANVNEMGEVPVLVHGAKKLSQSGVILTYLAERSQKFMPRGDDERLEALRWIIFDNQKLNGSLAPFRYLRWVAKPRPIRPCWNSSRPGSTMRSAFSTSASPVAPTCSGRSRPSPIFRWSVTSIIRPRNSASTWPPTTRTSRLA